MTVHPARLAAALSKMPPAHARALLGKMPGITMLPTAADLVAQVELHRAQVAFEADMQPICNALVEALQSGDLDALKGLRAMLPHILEEVNAEPALADVLAHQLGRELLKGFTASPARTPEEMP